MKVFELVLCGHPDKICDGIAEEMRKANPKGRSAIEVAWFNETIMVGGETDKSWTWEQVRDVVQTYLKQKIYLTDDEIARIEILNRINEQSQEINSIVGEFGAGDNGIFYGGWHVGYSSAIDYMKKLCAELTASLLAEWGYRTDGKMLFWVSNKNYYEITRVVLNIASFKDKKPCEESLRSFVYSQMPHGSKYNIEINPRGNWHKCFGFADSGLTGRKIACDSQCGLFHNGGGALFGKDESKADRSVNQFLTHLALEEKSTNRYTLPVEIELVAHTIIGDSSVVIYDNDGKMFGKYSFAEIKKYAKNHPIDIFGREIEKGEMK